jgi:ElaB/YqjD/DUF883 family membrane-anchored ribosome-binding protein
MEENDTDERKHELRAEMQQARARLDGTLDVLEERLNPGHLADQAKSTVRNATVGRLEETVDNARETARGAGEQMLETIRRNPVPAAIAGLGIGWLITQGRSDARNGNGHGTRTGSGYSTYGGERYMYDREPQALASEQGGGLRDTLSSATGSARESVSSATDSVRGSVASATGAAKESVSSATDSVMGSMSSVTERVQDVRQNATQMAGESVHRASSQIERVFHERPLAVAGAAVALGVAVGLVLPETERERALLGETRDNLMDSAKSAVQDTQHRVQSALEDVQSAAVNAAQSQGLAPA